MNGICTLNPFVGDEESILYKELYKRTGKNRKLTNYLYALSLQPSVQETFASSDFNRQGEVNASSIMEALKVDEILEAATQIANAERELGAVTDTGKVQFDTVDEIYDRVQEFNSRPDNHLIASITQENRKFIINVDTIGAGNFRKVSQLEVGRQQLENVMMELEEADFDVSNLSPDAKLALNELNVGFFTEQLSLLKSINKMHHIRPDVAQLVFELMRDNGAVKAFLNKFESIGADPVEVLNFLMTGATVVPDNLQRWETQILDSQTQTRYTALIRAIKTEFAKVNINKIKTKNIELYKTITPEEQQNTQKTLNYLYEKWHIDQESISMLYDQINNIEDLTNAIIARMKNHLKILQTKGAISSDELNEQEKQIRELEKSISKKEYFNSINFFLNNLLSIISNIEDIDTTGIDENTSMEDINSVALSLATIKSQIEEFSPVVKALLDPDNCLGDEIESSDKKILKELAIKIHAEIGKIEQQFKNKQFHLVYNAFRKFWGDDLKSHDSISGNNFETSLREALYCGDVNINIFDRMFFALTEISDPVVATLGAMIKDMHQQRDEALEEVSFKIRVATDKLYSSGSDSSFMFETDSKGNVHIISRIDWDAYYKEREELKNNMVNQGYSQSQIAKRLTKWEEDNNPENHLSDYLLSDEEINRNRTHQNRRGGSAHTYFTKFRKSLPSMSSAQKEYYDIMLEMKGQMESYLNQGGVKTFLFTPIQISRSMMEDGNDITLEELKHQAGNIVKIREDDTNYGNLEVLEDAQQRRVKGIPTYYLTKLKDQSRLSKDFSKTMLAFSSMAINYTTLNSRINILELSKDFLLERPLAQSEGVRKMVQTAEVLGKRVVSPAVRRTRETMTGSYIEDLFDKTVYGEAHKKGKEFEVFGHTISTDKIVEDVTQYTSITGLAMNVPGAVANALVGKLQMLIEAGGGEFWNMKSFTKGTAQYYQLLPALLAEITSNNKSSMLGLLMEKFDVLGDMYQKMKDTGFYKNPIYKIVGNSSLFFLYGMGEHLLHAQGMLACLDFTKVLDPDGNEVPLFEVFDREFEGDNARLIIKEGYKTKQGTPIDNAYIRMFKNRVSYVNDSLHGAFSDDEKGMIHRYALGRLVMNFRQWMPAHYARRFNKLHWDAKLGDFREGYYVTTAKFLYEVGKDLTKGQFTLYTHWKDLKENHPMEFANLKRAITEYNILVVLGLLSRLEFGNDPKHRGWWEALVKYEIKRMLLETGASAPGKKFVDNIITLVNSPIPSINNATKLSRLFGIEDLIMGTTIQSGPHKGELKYFRNVERALPFYDQVYKWWNMDTDDSMFKIFGEK